MDINNILLSTGLSTGVFIVYKIINNYRLKSECNQENQLVISVVPPTTETHPQPHPHVEHELEEIKVN